MPTTETPAATTEQPFSEYLRTENAREQRESTGEPQPAAVPTAVSPESGTATVDPAAEAQPPVEAPAERNADGTFKAKEKAEPAKKDGDPRKSVQAKINEEVRLRREAERKALAAEERAAALEAKVNGTPAVPAVPTSPAGKTPTYAERVKRYMAEPGWPKLDQFQDFEDPYAAAVAAQSAYVQERQREDVTAQQNAADAETALRQKMADTYKTGADTFADWNDLLASPAGEVNLPEPVMQELYNDPLSADLIHHLLTHPDDLAAAATMADPIAAARFVTKLSVGLHAASSGPAAAPQAVTKAKSMIKPVMNTPAAPAVTPPDELPFGPEYIRRMNEQDRKREEAARGAR